MTSADIVPFRLDGNRGQPLKMSSSDIAEVTEKLHKNVIRDIRTMLVGLYGSEGQTFESMVEDGSILSHLGKSVTWEVDARGYVTAFHLDKEHTLTLVSGYDVRLRKRIVDKLAEIESGKVVALPNFADPVAAARAWADELEARQIAERTKAEIGTRREATAMNTASQAVKKANRLELELDKSRSYASVKRMSMLYHGQEFDWRMLKRTSIEMGILPIDVFDANYGTVKAYHADVWREAYALDIPAAGEAA